MNYEKEYKKLKADIKKAYLFAQTNSTKTVLEHILPELKESNGEEIRKNIISYLHNEKKVKRYISDIEFDKWIAWLEKQRESQNEVRYWTEEEIEPIISDYLRGAEHYGGMIARLRCLKPKSLEKQGERNPYSGVSFKYNGHTWGMCARDNGVEILVDGEIKERVYLYNRPQGKSALEAAKEEKVDNQNCVKDNYKPKFHEGDWISGYYTNYRVTAINREGYVVEDTDGNKINILFENEKFHHLWTVKDIKVGDVLYCKADNGIEFFVMNKGVNECGNIDSYFRYNSLGDFGVDIPSVLSAKDDNITPATKEQCDFLFNKLKEAGYGWDAEKKALYPVKLTKLEDKLSSLIVEAVHTYCAEKKLETPHFVGLILGDRMAKEWSSSILELAKVELLLQKKDSVKDSDWSEEDEIIYAELIKYFESLLNCLATEERYNENRRWLNWLKSLKFRKQWKPSEEQMNALAEALILAKNCGEESAFDLRTLYEQLKKL